MRFVVPLLFFLFALHIDHAIAADTSISPTDSDPNTNPFCPVPDHDRQFLAQILDALKKDDIAWIANHMNYPISIDTDGKKQIVNTKEEFIPIAKQRFTDDVRAKIADDAKEPLFKNWQGAMVGAGILWFSQYWDNETGRWKYEIDAIGNFAWQTDELDPSADPDTNMLTVTDAEWQFLGQTLNALKRKDIAWIADHMIYPISIVSGGKIQTVSTREEFIPIARQRLSDDVCARMVDAAKRTLYKSFQEVAIGDGILGFVQYGNGLKSFGIVAVGYFAFQPDDWTPGPFQPDDWIPCPQGAQP
jgi:hypothetical protein